MKYGEQYETYYTSPITGKRTPTTETYRYVEYGGYHTGKNGTGLWLGDRQIMGTCDFSVTGCKTEKAAKAKVRNLVKSWEGESDE